MRTIFHKMSKLLTVSLENSQNISFLKFIFDVDGVTEIIRVNTFYLVSIYLKHQKDKDAIHLRFSKKILDLKYIESMSPDSDFFYSNKNTFTFYCGKDVGDSIVRQILSLDTKETA